ncbi:uncharacterized protein TRAVEDRAFT_20824 [Trametes versicolor FP-101664 SS1]|uniref:uncharacterized protein n=1 Tax=Trametes versicolor (strain FP-101664) TaxID=717944 RepID=UPI000462431C|nr:uncharacterized protein TRAVEDRAFT_20824 [Trametes versicolor FP-101664 SS1]EIW59030.1 hypothetical protein TRAVEDRAFT_20824 [Trametes versicolor FP-101664 SS1]
MVQLNPHVDPHDAPLLGNDPFTDSAACSVSECLPEGLNGKPPPYPFHCPNWRESVQQAALRHNDPAPHIGQDTSQGSDYAHGDSNRQRAREAHFSFGIWRGSRPFTSVYDFSAGMVYDESSAHLGQRAPVPPLTQSTKVDQTLFERVKSYPRRGIPCGIFELGFSNQSSALWLPLITDAVLFSQRTFTTPIAAVFAVWQSRYSSMHCRRDNGGATTAMNTRDDREPEKVHTSNSITDAGEADPPNERSPEEDVAQDHENTWDALREPWATSDPMLALDLAVKQILHAVRVVLADSGSQNGTSVAYARCHPTGKTDVGPRGSMQAQAKMRPHGRGATPPTEFARGPPATSNTGALAFVVPRSTRQALPLFSHLLGPFFKMTRMGIATIPAYNVTGAMSHTAQIRPDFDVASHNNQDLEEHPPHAMTAQDSDSDVKECQCMPEAAEKMKVSLVLAYQTLETRLAGDNRLSALSVDQPKGPLAPAGTMTPTSLSPPQSHRSSIAGSQQIYMPSAPLFEPRSRSDNAVTGSEDAAFPMDSVSESVRHSPETAVSTTEPDDSYDSDYVECSWRSRSSPILFGDYGFDEYC